RQQVHLFVDPTVRIRLHCPPDGSQRRTTDGRRESRRRRPGATFAAGEGVAPRPAPGPSRRIERRRRTMKVGVLLVFQNWHEDLSDEEMWMSEIHLGELAEPLGYDSVWSVEHHFD